MKPNIIIVMTDQQRASLRGSEGFPLDTMPFLDAWAESGADFACAYTPNPSCLPARVSMFTGRYPSAHRARTNHNGMDALYTADLLDVLHANGYQTALCGKNHTHRKPDDFDYCVSNGHLGGEGGKNSVPPTEEEQAFDRYLQSTKFRLSADPAPGDVTLQYPYRNVTHALDFIDTRDRQKPFFAWISFSEPHNPYQVPRPYYDLFPPESLPPITTGPADLPGKGPRYVWMRSMWEKVMGEGIEEETARIRSNYLGMLRLIDDQFKRLIEGLRERGLEKDTLVVFLSDHGDFAGEYGLIRKGPDLCEALCRIPMVFGGAQVAPQGKVPGRMVSLVDILPTVCDLIGAGLPFGCQGKSLLPLLEGRDIPEGEWDVAYSESGFSGLYWDENDALDPIAEGATKCYDTFDCLNTWTQAGQVRMARKGDYKVQLDMMGSGYLYYLPEDPHEVHNLWDSPEHTAIKAEMLAGLSAAILRAQDPIPAPRHRYRVKVHPKGYWFESFHSPDPGVYGK
ncbi:MAG: sulfatase-like hydrolase/transferase [Provencibacterium sp.]|nr:sulfatase-like hydrolase/transferase [Provencibacterium sp.]